MRAQSIRTVGASALSALLLAGCVVGPNFSPPTPDTPPTWVTPPTAGQTVPSRVTPKAIQESAWWASFGDAELSSLIGRAEASNLDAKQAVLRIDEARSQRRIAAAGAWPQLTGGASYTSTRISEATATTSLLSSLVGQAKSGAPGGVSGGLPGLSNPFNQYQYGLTASWEIDLFGRVRRTVEAAEAETEAATEDARAVRVSLMAEVAAAYIDLRAVQAERAVVSQNLRTSRDILKLAEDARRTGLGDDYDVAGAAAAAASAEAQLPPLERQAAADRNQIALLLAQKPGALDSELDSAVPVPLLPPQVPIGLPSELARRRPDIRAAEAELHAAVARQGVAVADLYPSISLSAAPGFEASRPAALTQWAAAYLAMGPTIDLPIFDAGQRVETIHLQNTRAKEAALAYAQTVLGALNEVEDAIAAYDQDQARRQSLETAASQSQTALDLARRRFEVGSVSFRDVLDAEDKLQQAQLALTGSTAASAEDLVGLYKALGGGWEAGDFAAAR